MNNICQHTFPSGLNCRRYATYEFGGMFCSQKHKDAYLKAEMEKAKSAEEKN